VLGFALCSEADPCRLHHDWERSMSSVRRILSELTIDDIGKGEVIPLKHAANSPL
jgi:DNA-binding IscR family transcriptional regulator